MLSCGLWLGPRRLVVALREVSGTERLLSVSPSGEAKEAFLAYLSSLGPVALVVADVPGIRAHPLLMAAAACATEIHLTPAALLEGILAATSAASSARRRARILARLPASPLRLYLQRLPAPNEPARQLPLL